MSFQVSQQSPLPISDAQMAESFIAAMQRVYLWMFFGLLVTTATALVTVSSSTVLSLVFSSPAIFMGLVFGELLLVLGLSAAINRLSPVAALSLFFLYAALNGVTMSVIFLAYDLGVIFLAFGTTALLFGVMSLVGYTTKQDLTRWGSILFMGLIGFVIASVANMYLANSALEWILTYVGIILFLGLTIYDTRRIKTMTYASLAQGDALAVSRVGILGALRLYLDFVNLFLLILRLFGRRR